MYNPEDYAAGLRRFSSLNGLRLYLGPGHRDGGHHAVKGAADTAVEANNRKNRKKSHGSRWAVVNLEGRSLGPRGGSGVKVALGGGGGGGDDHGIAEPTLETSDSGPCREMGLRQFGSITELLAKLRADLRGSFPSFAREFIDLPNDGVTLLLDTLKAVQAAQSSITGSLNQLGSRANHVMLKQALADEFEVLQCLKATTSSRHPEGPAKLMAHQTGLFTVSVCLMSNCSKSRVLALQLLDKLCRTGSAAAGHKQVADALSMLRLRFGEPIRFKFLVGMLNSYHNNTGAFQVSCLRFLNRFLETSQDAKERVMIQTELEEAGFDPAVLRPPQGQRVMGYTAASEAAAEGPTDDEDMDEAEGEEAQANDLFLDELDRWDANYVDVNSLVRRLAEAEAANSRLREELELVKRSLSECLRVNGGAAGFVSDDCQRDREVVFEVEQTGPLNRDDLKVNGEVASSSSSSKKGLDRHASQGQGRPRGRCQQQSQGQQQHHQLLKGRGHSCRKQRILLEEAPTPSLASSSSSTLSSSLGGNRVIHKNEDEFIVIPGASSAVHQVPGSEEDLRTVVKVEQQQDESIDSSSSSSSTRQTSEDDDEDFADDQCLLSRKGIIQKNNCPVSRDPPPGTEVSNTNTLETMSSRSFSGYLTRPSGSPRAPPGLSSSVSSSVVLTLRTQAVARNKDNGSTRRLLRARSVEQMVDDPAKADDDGWPSEDLEHEALLNDPVAVDGGGSSRKPSSCLPSSAGSSPSSSSSTSSSNATEYDWRQDTPFWNLQNSRHCLRAKDTKEDGKDTPAAAGGAVSGGGHSALKVIEPWQSVHRQQHQHQQAFPGSNNWSRSRHFYPQVSQQLQVRSQSKQMMLLSGGLPSIRAFAAPFGASSVFATQTTRMHGPLHSTLLLMNGPEVNLSNMSSTRSRDDKQTSDRLEVTELSDQEYNPLEEAQQPPPAAAAAFSAKSRLMDLDGGSTTILMPAHSQAPPVGNIFDMPSGLY